MVRDIRVDYRDGGPIVITNANKPLSILKDWIKEAIDNNLIEANAMCISTVSQDGLTKKQNGFIKTYH